MASKRHQEFDLDRWLDNLIECLHGIKTEDTTKHGNLSLSNTLESKLFDCEGDVNSMIKVFYDEMQTEYNYLVTKYEGLLDAHDIEEILFDSIIDVGYFSNTNEIGNFRALARKCLHDNCVDLIRKRKAKKRGGDVKFHYLDDKRDDRKQVQIECVEKAYDTVDFLEWLEQIKPTLSDNEYNYLKLAITENHFDNMSNTEIAKELNVTEGTIRNIKKNLKSNKHLLALLHK